MTRPDRPIKIVDPMTLDPVRERTENRYERRREWGVDVASENERK